MPGSGFTLFLVLERMTMTIASRTEITAAAIAREAELFISGGAGGGGGGVDHGRAFNSLSMEVRISTTRRRAQTKAAMTPDPSRPVAGNERVSKSEKLEDKGPKIIYLIDLSGPKTTAAATPRRCGSGGLMSASSLHLIAHAGGSFRF